MANVVVEETVCRALLYVNAVKMTVTLPSALAQGVEPKLREIVKRSPIPSSVCR